MRPIGVSCLLAGAAQTAVAGFGGLVVIGGAEWQDDALADGLAGLDLNGRVARDVGADVDEDVALVVGEDVVPVDKADAVAQTAVLLDAQPGLRDHDQAEVGVQLALDAGGEGDAAGVDRHVAQHEGDGGEEVVPGGTGSGTDGQLDGVIGFLHDSVRQVEPAADHVVLELIEGHLAELRHLAEGVAAVDLFGGDFVGGGGHGGFGGSCHSGFSSY